MLTARDLEKQIRPREAGAADGKRDFPPSNAVPYASETEQAIQSLCQEQMASEYDAFLRKIAKARNEIAAIRNSMSVDIANRANALKAGLRRVVREHGADIKQAADQLEKRAKDLRHFKVLNELSYEPNYDDSLARLVGTGILIIAAESAANAYFFGQASEAGLVGGFFTAGMISATNVGLGFITGVGLLRQLNHIKKWRLILAIPCLFVLAPLATVFNLIVGHYREALLKNPDALILDVLPTAMSNLFGIKSFESMILILLGLFIFGLSVYKGYKVWDTYPGYMSKHRAMRDAEDQLNQEREHISEQVDQELGDDLEQFINIGRSLNAKRAGLESIGQKIDGDFSGLNSSIDQIEQAGNTTIKVYRSANQQVRSPRIPSPAYFQTQFRLDRPTEILELKRSREELLAAFSYVAEAEKAFQSTQLELTTERIAIMGKLEETIANAETDAKARAKAEFEQEKADRELLRVTTP